MEESRGARVSSFTCLAGMVLQWRLATTHHSFRGSFSAVSTPIFTIKDAFCSIFQNLQNLHTSAGLETLKKMQISQKSEHFCEILQTFLKIRKNHENFRNFRKKFRKFYRILKIQLDHFVDLEKMLQNAPLIVKIGVDTAENEPPKE